MKKAEIILIISSLIALIINLLIIPGGAFLTILTLSSISLLYCYFSFALFNNIRLRKIFQKESYKETTTLKLLGTIFTGFTLSTTIIGILFKFQRWPGAYIMLLVGVSGLLIVISISIIKYLNNKSEFYLIISKRVAIFGGIGLFLILMRPTFLVEFKYRNYPNYVNAVKKLTLEPNNKHLQKIVDEERKKMDDLIYND